MANQVIYYYPFISTGSVRKEFQMIIADSQVIFLRDREANPEAFVRIPDTAISISDPSAASYAGSMALGVPTPMGYRITFHLGEIAGSTALDALRAAVTDYEDPTAGVVYVGSIGGTRTFPTANTCWILSNDGSAVNESPTLRIPTRCEFIGVQVPVPGGEGIIRIGHGVSLTFDLVNIVTAVLQTVRTSWVSHYAVSLVNYTAPWKSFNFGQCFDIAFETLTEIWDVRHAPGNGQVCNLFNEIKWWKAAQEVCSIVLGAFLRYPAAEWAFRGPHAISGASPWDHWKFRKQNYAANHGVGAILARDERGVIGLIRKTASDPPFAGLYQPGQDGLEIFETLGEFLKQSCEASVCRATIDYGNQLTVNFTFYRLLDAAFSTTAQLTLNDILTGERREVPFQMSANMIRRVDVARRGAQGQFDQSAWKFSFEGAGTDSPWNLKMIFDSNPALANDVDYYGRKEASSGIFSGTSYLLEIRRFYPWKFYYLDDPMGASVPVPFRVHEVADFELGPGSTITGEYDPLSGLPWPTVTDAVFNQTSTNSTPHGWVNPIRSATGAAIRNNGMGYLAARALNAVFGSTDLTSYTFDAYATRIKPSQVGDSFILPDGPTAEMDSSGLVATGQDYLILPGWCILVNHKMDPATNKATCVLQGLRRT